MSLRIAASQAAGLAGRMTAAAVLCQALAFPLHAATVDSLVILRPAPGAVITGNSFILETDVNVPDDSVLSVEFHAGYFKSGYQQESGKTSFYQNSMDTLICVDSAPPYQWIWDIGGILDHYHTRMWVYAVARTRNGNAIMRRADNFVVDRNPDLSDRTALSVYRAGGPSAPVLDTKLPVGSFRNGGDQIWFQSLWDGDSLYFVVSVEDTRIVPADTTAEGADGQWWYGDDIEIFLDVNNRRAVFDDTGSYQIVLRPDGLGYGGRLHLRDTLRFAVNAASGQGP